MQTGSGRMLDIGCGAGFMIDLARDLFDEIHGLDPTRAMLDEVDVRNGKVTLHEGVAEHLPFADGSFDLVTAYSVFHHLADHRPVLAEAARVLRRGGMLYVDLEPNRLFWQAIAQVEKSHNDRLDEIDEIVGREIDAVLHIDDQVRSRYEIDPAVFRQAEYIKSELGGFDPAQFEADAIDAGLSTVSTTHEWFLGQGVLLHGDSPMSVEIVETHLRRLLPLTAPLFKYLRFEAQR
ncbi:MAG: class I SAM-dependent methyltransferase [Actinobacteria bacterium]|nr:class I SAM-dependent methyltransferase [Actinomycetota bacterium]